jgi:hypothetical protein
MAVHVRQELAECPLKISHQVAITKLSGFKWATRNVLLHGAAEAVYGSGNSVGKLQHVPDQQRTEYEHRHNQDTALRRKLGNELAKTKR